MRLFACLVVSVVALAIALIVQALTDSDIAAVASVILFFAALILGKRFAGTV